MTHTRRTGRGAARAPHPRPLPIRWELVYSIQAAASPHLIGERPADNDDPTNDRQWAFRPVGSQTSDIGEEAVINDSDQPIPGAGTASPANAQSSNAFADADQLARQIADVAQKSQNLVAEFLKRQSPEEGIGMASPLAIGAAFFEMTARMISDPSRLVQAQLSLWNDYLTLWQRTAQRFLGGNPEPMIEPPHGDRRFRDAAWTDNTLFDFIKQSYLLTARWLQGTVREVEGIDERTARKVDFYTRQFVDALAPSNFLMTNPEDDRNPRRESV
jgi:hypothetical protein